MSSMSNKTEAGQPRGMEAERADFSEWVATAVPFDANVGMVEHRMKTDAAWRGWMARAAAQDFREVLPASMASPAGRHPKLPLLPPDDEALLARVLKLAEQIDTEEVCGHVVAQQLREMTKAERVHALVNDGPWPGMSEAFDAHMGVALWTETSFAQEASLWAAAWKAAKRAEQPRDVQQGLTDEQIDALWRQAASADGFTTAQFVREFARAIERATLKGQP